MNTRLNPVELPALSGQSRMFLAHSRHCQANADDVSALTNAKCGAQRVRFNTAETKMMIESDSAFWMESGICSAAQVDRLFGTV